MKSLHILLLLALAGTACADTGGDIANEINGVICLFVRLIWLVTGSLMAIVVIFAGVKWLVSGDDAGARASAKMFIISAFVGLIIIFTAVPVVDYLVGGILGYEFECGFFPEVDSGFLGGDVPESLGEDRVVIQSVDPLTPSGGAVLELSEPVLSRSVSGSGGLFACFTVSNTGGYPADIGDHAASLYDGASLVYSGVCSPRSSLLDAGGSVDVVCDLGLSISGDFQGYELYVRAGDAESSYGLGELSVDPYCRGVRLVVQSSDENPIARIKSSGGFSDSADVVLGSSQNVIFHVLWNGESSSYSWSVEGVTIPTTLGNTFNMQFFGLNSEDIRKVFPDPDSYTISVNVVGRDSGKAYPANTVTLNVLSPADARAGLSSWGISTKSYPDRVDVASGSSDVVVLYAVWDGKESMHYKWTFPWSFTGRDGNEDNVEEMQMVGLKKDALPKDAGEYVVKLEVTLDGKTYEDSVTINIREEGYVSPKADAKIGLSSRGTASFKDSVEYVIGSSDTVVLYADDVKGSGTLTYEWDFEGRPYTGQLTSIPSGDLPRTPGNYKISFTLTDDYGAAYKEDVWIKAGTETREQRIERYIFEMVNAERAKAGRSQLVHEPALRSIARSYSQYMASVGRRGHSVDGKDPSQRYAAAGYTCGGGAENVHDFETTGYTEQLSDYDIAYIAMYKKYLVYDPPRYRGSTRIRGITINGLMFSTQGHRDNILNPTARNIGVGVAFRGDNVYVTQNFC